MSRLPLIRPLVSADLERVLEINRSNVPEVGPLDHGGLTYLADEAAIVLCVDHEDEIVGFCLVLAGGSTYDSVNYRWCMDRYPDARGTLDRVAFVESFSRTGLGHRVVRGQVDRRIRSDFPDATGLTLEVNVDPPNEPSLRFHERLGFTEVGRQMSHGIEVSLMRRPLID